MALYASILLIIKMGKMFNNKWKKMVLLVEEPTVQCGIDSLSFEIKTNKPFSGRLFVSGFSQEKHCQLLGNGSLQRLQFTVQFGQCGLRRSRELNGISVQTIVIVSFHPIFVTKLDRAYRLNCFYTETRKTFTQHLEVGQLTTSGNIFRKSDAMPQCRYDILWQNARGQSIRFARIGDVVFHRWSCQTPEVGTYCMRVHSCTVSDGQGGEPVEVIDRKGCGVDALLLRDLEYTDDLSAGQSAFVFKFADKPSLHFNCQIELTLREEWSNNGCEPNRPKCLPSSTYQYTQQFQQAETTTAKIISKYGLQYDSGNEALEENKENVQKDSKNILPSKITSTPLSTTKPTQIIREKELPPAHYRINEDWRRRTATTATIVDNNKIAEKMKFPQTEVVPSNYATEFPSTTEENILESSEALSLVDLMQQDAIYQDEVNSPVRRETPANNQEIDRRLPRKVADFDLPEQSLLVIELDEHSLANQPMILRLLNNSVPISKHCRSSNNSLAANFPFGSILLFLLCLLILLLALIWNYLTKQLKNNEDKNNNCVLIGHKRRNKLENILLWRRKQKTFPLPQFEQQQKDRYFSASIMDTGRQFNNNNLTTVNRGLRF
uniref:ZP domain-containing protein n=1 Tax=Meloidogyne hapla TaxID=6305 RepID=A0A1I8BKU8_MELHA